MRRREEEAEELLDEERRLLYVGMTRAKKKLYLMYRSRATLGGSGSNSGSGKAGAKNIPIKPSRFPPTCPRALASAAPRHDCVVMGDLAGLENDGKSGVQTSSELFGRRDRPLFQIPHALSFTLPRSPCWGQPLLRMCCCYGCRQVTTSWL